MAMAAAAALGAASFSTALDHPGLEVRRLDPSSRVVFRSVRLRPVRGSPNSSAPVAPSDAQSGRVPRDKDGDVKMINTQLEFDSLLQQAGQRLVVVEYAASHSVNSKKIYPAMVELSRTCPDVLFRVILGDESEETQRMFKSAGVVKVPHFIFYKNNEKVHEEEGITEDRLLGDVLYYGDSSLIQQLHSRGDVEALIEKHRGGDKLIVLDVGLKHCGPCVKVYPTVIKLARKMAGSTVFARMHGDENDDCMSLLKEMDVVEVPTFVFIRNGEVMGRYVGSGKGELIGEILKHQGVRVT